MTPIVLTKPFNRERSPASHNTELQRKTTDALTDALRNRSAPITFDDFVNVRDANLYLFGHHPDFKCSVANWYEMDGYQDPFVVALVDYLYNERTVDLNREEIPVGEAFIDLRAYGRGAFFAIPSFISERSPDRESLTALAAINGAILNIARALDSDARLINKNPAEYFYDTVITVEAVMAASKIYNGIEKSYPLGELSRPYRPE